MKTPILIILLLLFVWNLQAQETISFTYNHDIVDSNWIDILTRESAKGERWFNAFMDGMISRGEAKENDGFWFVTLIEEEVYDAPAMWLFTDQDYNLQLRLNGVAPFEITGSDTIARVAKSIKYRQITVSKTDFEISVAFDIEQRNPSDAFMAFTFPEKVYRSKEKKMKDLRSHMKKMKKEKK